MRGVYPETVVAVLDDIEPAALLVGADGQSVQPQVGAPLLLVLAHTGVTVDAIDQLVVSEDADLTIDLHGRGRRGGEPSHWAQCGHLTHGCSPAGARLAGDTAGPACGMGCGARYLKVAPKHVTGLFQLKYYTHLMHRHFPGIRHRHEER